MNYKYILVIITILITNVSCDDFLEVDDPKGQIPSTTIFNNELTAQAALLSIYSDLRNYSSMSGSFSGNAFVYGIYSDELDYNALSNQGNYAIYLHQTVPSNTAIKDVWTKDYKLIYACNALIEGLDNSQTISIQKRNLWKGEALFIRSLLHYNLAQSFGNVPYVTSTDYTINSNIIKLPYNEVIHNVIADLNSAKHMIGNENISSKSRGNKYIISTVLARIYLQIQEWQNAFSESEEVIISGYYTLENDLTKEFLANSTSTIFHLPSSNSNTNSVEGSIYIYEVGPPNNAALNEDFVQSFNDQDLRRLNWVRGVFSQNKFWYMPYKYKEKNQTTPAKEHSIVFRLAEIYLIKAEAAWRLNNSQTAIDALNKVRTRAGLNTMTIDNYNNFFEVLKYERKHELFLENGNRWFDLKRWGEANRVLSPIKPGWNIRNLLFPIPDSEILINPNLLPQNEGYN